MSNKALFSGLIVDEFDNPVDIAQVGSETFYVIDDAGFKRHIPSEDVDRQVLNSMKELIEGHEGIISEQAAELLGQDDIFSRAIIENQLKNLNKQFNLILETGIPEEVRAYMGMTGFRVRINIHGEVLEVKQPGMSSQDE